MPLQDLGLTCSLCSGKTVQRVAFFHHGDRLNSGFQSGYKTGNRKGVSHDACSDRPLWLKPETYVIAPAAVPLLGQI